jgi:hypothetical protein
MICTHKYNEIFACYLKRLKGFLRNKARTKRIVVIKGSFRALHKTPTRFYNHKVTNVGCKKFAYMNDEMCKGNGHA